MTSPTDIISRFFEALAYLKQSGQLRGVKTFTDKYGIDRRNLHHSKNRPGCFKITWLVHLIEDYNISARWLMVGAGKMIEQRKRGPLQNSYLKGESKEEDW